jgi:uncharacterized protein YjfI (DUF2170 family)
MEIDKMTKITLAAETAPSKSLNYNELVNFNLDVVLPLLTGTEKQIKWANDLRASFLTQMKSHIIEVAKNAEKKLNRTSSEFTDAHFAVCQKAVYQMIISTVIFIHKNQNATFWIDNNLCLSKTMMVDWFRAKSGFKSQQDIMDCYNAI